MPSHTNTDKCIGCGACEMNCPTNAIKMSGLVAIVNEVLCIECGACIVNCPAEARNINDVLRA